MNDDNATATGLVDKESIRQVVAQFAWSFDRADWTTMRAILAEQVQMDYSDVSGAEPELVPAAEQIERWKEFVQPLDSWQHVTSAPLMDVTGDEAIAHVNVVAWLRRDGVAGPSIASSGGTWTFALTHDGGAWRIRSMTATASWFDGNQAVTT